MIDAVDVLRKADMLDCLHLLHYHLGSQLPAIQHIRHSLLEAAQYVGLVKEGAPMGVLDIGGGLAVDYDGSNTNLLAPETTQWMVLCRCCRADHASNG